MAEWRVGVGWSEDGLRERLEAIRSLDRNFDPDGPMTAAAGWRRHESETVVGREGAGPPEPGGLFRRAWAGVTRYEFSDPRIVTAHFDPTDPLEGRAILLELRPLFLRFLVGVRVGAVRHDRGRRETVRGFRYDTLEGHIEAGWEWFTLSKSHATGEVRFRIGADWRPGDFPNAWSRVGFRFLGVRYQRRWSRRAHERLRRIARASPPVPDPEDRLLHQGPPAVGTKEER